MALLSSRFRTHDRHLIIDHFSGETLSFYEPKKDALHLFFSPARNVHTVGLVSRAELCKQFICAGRRCRCTNALGPSLLPAHTRESVSSVSFVLFVSCLFLWYVTRLCYSVGSSRQLQRLECYIHMWSVAPEITTCTSDGSVDSVTRGVHWSKELSLLDMFKNSAFGPTLGWMKRCFWYLSRLRALGYFFLPLLFLKFQT